MAERRRAISSPVFYSALVACGMVGLYYGVELAAPHVKRWVEQWSLGRQMRSANDQVRVNAVLSMQNMPPDLTTPYLIDAVKDPSVVVRIAACRILAMRDTPDELLIPVVAAEAGNASDEIRVDAAQVFGQILARSTQNRKAAGTGPSAAGAKAAAILCQLLKDSSSEVRAEAADSLGEDLGPAPAELVAAADDADRAVRLAVARSLMRRNGPDDPTAARLLCTMVAEPAPIADRFLILKMLEKMSAKVHDRAIRALADLVPRVDPAVLPDVIACLGESGPARTRRVASAG